jgi:membrane protein implicated in regulation of membrane protease activity
MFLVGGLSLVGLVWLGAADDGAHHDGHGDGADGHGHGLLGEAAALLSVRGSLAAMTAGGAAGVLLDRVLHLASPMTVIGASLAAMTGAVAWRRVMRLMTAFDRNHSVSPDVLVGREGTLTVGIAGEHAPGVVQVLLAGVSQEYTAIAADGRAYAEGSRVLIVRLLPDQTVAVESSPYPALTSNT